MESQEISFLAAGRLRRERSVAAMHLVFPYTFPVEPVLKVISQIITILFAIGVVGCMFVIPMTAFQLFKVLFEPDTEEEVTRSASRVAHSFPVEPQS